MVNKYNLIILSYYAFLQTIHFIMNGVILILGNLALLSYASPLLSPEQSLYLLISSLIDFCIASPLGILGVIFIFLDNKIFGYKLLVVSLFAAIVSALFYITVLVYFGAFVLNTTNTIFGILFIPVILLMFSLRNKKELTMSS